MPMIRGPIAWAKLREPVPGFTKTQKEWTFDLGVDDVASKKLHDLECGDYIKPVKHPKSGKEHTLGMPWIKFTRREIKNDGTPAKPIRVVDANGKDWDMNVPIGNGSIVNVKFAVNEKQSGGMKPSVIAIQVWELKEYEGGEEFPTRTADTEEAWDVED